MSNKINIVISAEDKASKPIRGVADELDQGSGKANKFSSALTSLGGVLARSALALGAAGIAAGAAGTAIGFNFNSSVEQAETKLTAFMKDGEKVAKTLAWVKTEAAATQFSFTDMADAAANLTPVARSSGQSLEGLVKQAEILAALNPTEGLTGATFSLREALSGDWVSITDRFNLPRKRINELKAEGVPAMEIISRTLKEMGIDYSLVAKQGQTVSARWDQITDKLKMMAGQATKPIFDRVSKELGTLGDYDYAALGDKLAGIVSGTIAAFDGTVAFIRDVVTNTSITFTAVSDAVRGVWSDIQETWTNVTDFLKGTLESAIRGGGEAINWLGDRVKAGQDWFEKYEGIIKGVAITLGVVFGPALIRAGVLAVITGVKIAASGVGAGAGWVAGAAASSAAWVVHSAKMIVLSAGIYTLMAVDAAKAGYAWTISAAKSSVAWILHMGKVAAVSTLTSIKVALSAADAGWAWVFNGLRAAAVWTTQMVILAGKSAVAGAQVAGHALASGTAWVIQAARASFAWVITELPKIVAAGVATAFQATIHAGASSSAWIVAAAKSSFAWVVTELPKIMAGFVVMSGQAVVHAAVTSGAWIASASSSAIAWVITQLPRIIGAFVAMSGSAVVHAAIASGAWIASAAASSTAFTSLAALIATPIVMPAIAVGAAIASLVMVQDAANKARQAIDTAMKMDEVDKRASQDLLKAAKRGRDAGTISEAEFRRLVGIAANATGTTYSPGGQTLVGEHGPEIVNMPQGAQVIPAYRSREQVSGGGGGHTVIIQNMNVNNGENPRRIFEEIGFALELAS